MQWHNTSIESIINKLDTDLERGLTQGEYLKRIEEYGKNIIDDGNGKKGFLSKFIGQLNDFMVIILIISAIASFVVSYIGGEKDFVDSIMILGIVMLNAILGVIQESKAETAIDALKKLSAPKTKVLRQGKISEIPVENVVPGDIILLEAGDYVPADARLIECAGLKAEESAITGESAAVEKDINILPENTDLAERKNMVFSSSYITYGRGKAIAVETGNTTQVGKIAHLMKNEQDRQTPLQRRLGDIGKKLGIAAILLCLIIFVMGIFRNEKPFDMFMTSVSLGVAAIPEGLPAIVTIVLALGMQKMSAKNTIVRNLPSVETLGSATVICSDKTGTLTQNKMKVIKVTDCLKSTELAFNKRKFILMLSALCNDSKKIDRRFIGDPTETALSEAYEETSENIPDFKRVDEIPFSSERKLMTTIHHTEGKRYISATKGAVEEMLSICSKYLGEKTPIDIDDNMKGKILYENKKMAESGLRVLAIGYKEFETGQPLKKNCEKDIIFAGLVGLMDPPRKEVKDAVETCKKAGIRPVMITGDNAITAAAIAKNVGILKDGDICMTGKTIDETDDKTFSNEVENCTVFSRVSPEHKMKIVKALQKNGHVVAMTGDGVNDAPALKRADIGCAMGKNGTEVAKGAADMILTDDNFASIVEAVKEGRKIYGNIKKTIHFLLSSNVGELFTVFFAMIFGWKTPLLPIQLLWVNFVTDSLPAIALGVDNEDKDLMSKSPVNPNEGIFSFDGWVRVLLEGCMIGMLAILAFGIGHVYFDNENGYSYARTMAFGVLSISQLFHAFNMRTDKSIFSINILSNKYLVGAFLLGITMQFAAINMPIISDIFSSAHLGLEHWLIVIGLSVIPIIIVELEKFFTGNKDF